jgi:hypothetical protein
MAEGFSGEPVTRWTGERNMLLVEALSYGDRKGKIWEAPAGSEINGATIPQALWTSIGAPFVGNYRRATIVHDYFVGELSNPVVTAAERKAADRMFYHACRIREQGRTPSRKPTIQLLHPYPVMSNF